MLTMIALVFFSCSNKKKYKYVETLSKGALFDDFPGDTIIIEALSDSAAYVAGLDIFEEHKKVSKDMKEVFRYCVKIQIL